MALDKHAPAVQSLLRGIEAKIETKRNALERPQKTRKELAYIQGEIKSLRWAMDLITGVDDEDESTG